MIPFENILFPLLTDEWLHIVLYVSTEYYNSVSKYVINI
jgi:hypothetical protein